VVENKDIVAYLKMQHDRYEVRAKNTVIDSNGISPESDEVVGNYSQHASFPYDDNILKCLDKNPSSCSIIEYGCGPGRNLLRMANRFTKVSGVDISEKNLYDAKRLLDLNSVKNYALYHTPGDCIPIQDEIFDIVFEVICLQHVCSYTIRKKILSDMARVCRLSGLVVCQFGFNEGSLRNPHYAGYYDDKLIGVTDTNGWADCCVQSEDQLKNDFKDIGLEVVSLWYTGMVEDIWHDKWVWVCGRKGM